MKRRSRVPEHAWTAEGYIEHLGITERELEFCLSAAYWVLNRESRPKGISQPDHEGVDRMVEDFMREGEVEPDFDQTCRECDMIRLIHHLKQEVQP